MLKESPFTAFWQQPMAAKMVQTLLFYAICISLVALGEWIVPSGPCTPGCGFLVGILAAPISLFLFAWNGFLLLAKGRDWLPSTLIHGLVIATIMVLLIQ